MANKRQTDFDSEEISPEVDALFRRVARRVFSPDPFTQMLAILDCGLEQLLELRKWIAPKAQEEKECSERLEKEVRAIKRRQARLGYRRIPRKSPSSPSRIRRERLQ
jgi:hypothetical protein